jgi:DNA mismatch repair protein MutS2
MRAVSSPPAEKLAAESLNLLEFDKVIKYLAGRTQTTYGRAAAAGLVPMQDRGLIVTALAEAEEAVRILGETGPLPVGQGEDLLPQLEGLRIEGRRLEPEFLLEVLQAIEAARSCRKLLLGKEDIPLLQELGRKLTPLPDLAGDIRRSIGPRGEVLDTASAQLGDLRRQVQVERGRIKRQLSGLLEDERFQGVFQEQLITDRNGRYVLPVRADHSGRIKGFVHDVSASGQTLYLEPATVLDNNNRVQMLQRDILREEDRILARLTEDVRSARKALADNQMILTRLDLRQATARLTRDLDGIIPELTEKPMLALSAARHPLLVLAAVDSRGDASEVVPVDIRLTEGQESLIVSGPNTGGKTVTLKTAGLLVLMARTGLPLPCAPASQLFPFSSVLANIGDAQSLEQSLSTFSGHLVRLRSILEQANDATLVLLDELGTGTDPSEGAALALAVLDFLRQAGARTIATTHLHVVKGYAHLADAVENVAVEFDADTLMPTYRLHYGIPGASHAFTIARRLGLPETVLSRAEDYLGGDEREGLMVVERLQSLRAALEGELDAAGTLRREAEQEKDLRQKLHRDLQERQKDILDETRQKGNRILSEAEEQLRELFREARRIEAKPREQARITRTVRELRQKLPVPESELPGVVPVSVSRGEILYVPSLGIDAEVVQGDASRVELVAGGGKKLRQPLASLRQYRPRKFAIKQKNVPRIRDRVDRKAFQPRLMLVGKRVDEAINLLDRFLDEALLHGQSSLEIVHGAGQGILRRAVREALVGRKYVTSAHAADLAQGGDNVTIVELQR